MTTRDDQIGCVGWSEETENGMKTYGHFINGTYVEPAGGKFIDSFNPYSGEVAGDTARLPPLQCRPRGDRGGGARWHEGAWSGDDGFRSGASFWFRLADLVAANAERLAEIEVHDNGKLLAEMLGQLRYGSGVVAVPRRSGRQDRRRRWCRSTSRTCSLSRDMSRSAWWRRPDGVELAAAISLPGSCAPALAAGCTVVVKPVRIGVRIDAGVRRGSPGKRVSLTACSTW